MVIAGRFEAQVGAALPHLSPRQVSALAGSVDRLVEAFKPDRIYVFGSQARGSPRSDSDIDVLVIVPVSEEPTYRLVARAYAEIAPISLPLEIVFMTRAEFDARAPATTSLPASVLREGRLLYPA